MRKIQLAPLFLALSIAGCSTAPKNVETASQKSHAYRHISSIDSLVNNREQLVKKVERLMDGVLHGYLIGQVYLFEFDRLLDKYPEKVMKSPVYSSLLSTRTFVEQFEHDLNDLYVQLVIVSALPDYSPDQKLNAQIALDAMGSFMEGMKADKKKINENLMPMILSNLMHKQTELYEELKALHDDESFTNNNPEVKKALHKNMVLLRATRLAYHKDLSTYKVDQKILEKAIKEERRKKNFAQLEKEIKDLSKEMKSFISELDRGTSSDVIFPTAGANGNITGRSFPQNTWSLTYDDGPGKTTGQIVDNLLARKIPATFFVLAKQVEGNPNTTKKLVDSGFEIASHSYTHAQLTKVGAAQLEREIGTAKKVIEDKTGATVKLFRLPYGAGVSVSNVRAKIAEHKMVHVFWTVDTLDWQDKNPTSIFNRTLKQMNASAKNSGIVLFHDIHSQSVTASTMLMDHFNKNKLTVCTVQGVVDQLNQNLPSCK